MIETVLKYLSVITVAGAAISFVVGLVKYLDQRNREVRTKRYELFNDLMRRVSARGEREDEGLPLTQQVAAIYELQHFEEYAYAAVPILKHMREYFTGIKAPSLVINAIDETLDALQK